MAFADLGSLGAVGNTNNNQASLVLTTTAAVSVGDLVVVVVAVDNPTNGGDSGVSGVQNSGTANTWVKAIQIQNAVAAQGGASCSIWYTQATSAIASGATITATFTNATTSDASALTARRFSVDAGSTVAIEGTPGTLVGNTAADPGSLNVTTANIQCLRVRGIASQVGNNTNLTPTASWTAWANGNSATTGTTLEMCARAESIINTGTGSASDPTYVSAIYASAYVAFREVLPATADAWNVNDKSANFTLSDSDKTATTSSAAIGGVRSTQQRTNGTAGKYYAEFLITNVVSGQVGIIPGLPGSVSATTGGSFRFSLSLGRILVDGTIIGTDIGATSNGDVICLAWDSGAERGWIRRNNGLWNNDAAANPATGANGVDLSSFTAVAYGLQFRANASGESVTVRTESAEFTYPGPSGFTSWMGEAFDAWNVNDKSANITLSNSDKTATSTSTSSGGVRSTTQYLLGAAGKYYAEFSLVSNLNADVGIKAAALGSINDTVSSAYVTDTGVVAISGAGVGINIGAMTSGDVVCLALDTGAQQIWFRKNGGIWNNNASADPATGNGGVDASGLADTNYCLWMLSSGVSGDSTTLRTELTEFTYTGPSGFTSWMGEALAAPAAKSFVFRSRPNRNFRQRF